MDWRRTSGLLVMLALVLAASGCKTRKKPNIPQQAQAPTITQPAPVATTQPGPPPPASVEPSRQLPTPGEVEASNIPPEPPPKPPRRTPRRTPPKRTVVENTPAPTPPPVQTPQQQQQGQLTASVSRNDAVQQKLDTQQLLEGTETNLRSLTRTLSSDEQVTVAHIRSYMQQSKNATTDRDYERAYNLALKARLLSDELVKK
jgi:type IV secretory pathway VirB10-like protein